jgi:hypothetical protein
MELMQFGEKKGRTGSLFSQETPWRNNTHQTEIMADDLSQENPIPVGDGVVLSPEDFFPLKVGMRVRHPKFGEGRVKSVEGMDVDQKVMILFQSVGAKRLKVKYATLEILE